MARKVASAVANARPARAASANNGGTTAPSRAAKSPTTGLGNNTAIDPNHPNYVPRTPKPQAAPVAAAAPPPARSTALPWDATAQSEAGAAQTKYGNTAADLAGAWAGKEGYYGFGENGASNPYSQAALLATHHEWNERGRSNASGLQAFSGSNVNAEHEEQGRYTTSYAQLLAAYETERAAKVRQEEAARRELESEEENAQLGAIGRAQETTPEPVAPGGGGGTPQKQGGGSSKKKSKDGKIAIGGAKKA